MVDNLLKRTDSVELKRIECEGVGDNNGFYEMSVPVADALRPLTNTKE